MANRFLMQRDTSVMANRLVQRDVPTELPPIDVVAPPDSTPIPGGTDTGSGGGNTNISDNGTLIPAGVSDNAGQSTYYLVVITSSRYGDVYAWMPDSVRLWVKSSWGPVVSNIESALANYIKILATGTTFFSKKLTAQEWRGCEPLTLQLPLHFFATKDANNEVIEPIKRLIKMSLPQQVGGDDQYFNLRAPGPVATFKLGKHEYGSADQDIINVYIGNFIQLKAVFIEAITGVEFKAKLSKDGLPMEGLCDVIFKTVFATTSQEIDLYMGNKLGSRPDIRLG